MCCAIGRGGAAVGPAEARRERPEAAEADVEADLGDRPIGVAQELRRALEPPGQQILMGRRAELPPELATEMGRRETGGAGKRGHVERITEAGVDQILGSQQVAGGSDRAHGTSMAEGGRRAQVARWA